MSGKLPEIERRKFTRVKPAVRRLAEGFVAIEEPLQIVVNGAPVALLMRSPGHEKELAAGFCISEGIIETFDDIGVIRHCGTSIGQNDGGSDVAESRNLVSITSSQPKIAVDDPRQDVMRLIRSGCGRADPSDLAATLAPVEMNIRVPQTVIAGLSRAVIEAQTAYRQAGGIHAVAIFNASGELAALGEDIGRHNAIDKAIGYCLLRRIPLRDKILYSTGRASYEMVVKAVRMDIPIVISRSSATTLAIDLAEQLNCTLIGYARGEKMQVYTHIERVLP